MWQFGILAIDLLTNLQLTQTKGSDFCLFQHDIWPFVQKILQHKEYLEYLLEQTFKNVVFNDTDFEACHDFLHKILCLEPNTRITAKQALEHKFVSVGWPQLPKVFSIPKVIIGEYIIFSNFLVEFFKLL